MSRHLLIEASPGELWAALQENDTLAALRLARTVSGSRVGEVYLGRITELRPDLPAAFVDIGLERPAFLSAEDAQPGSGIAGLHEGQAVIVQVKKDQRADKAAGVTMRLRPDPSPDRLVAIEAAARRGQPPLSLERPATPLARLLAEFGEPPPDAITLDDRAAFAEARAWLNRHHPEAVERLQLHSGPPSLFAEHGLTPAIEAVLAPRIALPGGGSLTIEMTAAATMIDVDSGRAVDRRRPAGAAILAVNLEAAAAMARQIRLRNLGGPIVVDFIGMRARRDRDKVREALIAGLAGDADTEVLGWTRLGHLELVRKRRQAPLADLIYERRPDGGLVKTALTTALEALRAAAREAEAAPGRPLTLALHPEVAALLDGAALPARRDLETRLGRPLIVTAVPGRARDGFDIRAG